jgi:hypothetical protein
MAPCDPVRRAARNLIARATYTSFLRSCGAGAVLAGVLFVVWGYIDRPNGSEMIMVAVHVLSFVVPMLFLAGVVGLFVLCQRWRGGLESAGIVLAFVGSMWGMVVSIANLDAVYAYLAQRGWPPHLFDWLLLVHTGLVLTGIVTICTKPLRGMGLLLLATGVIGWSYSLTDIGNILEARSVHVGCGVLFSVGWVVLGLRLWAGGVRQSEDPYVRS